MLRLVTALIVIVNVECGWCINGVQSMTLLSAVTGVSRAMNSVMPGGTVPRVAAHCVVSKAALSAGFCRFSSKLNRPFTNETEIKHRKIVKQFSTCFSQVSIFIYTLNMNNLFCFSLFYFTMCDPRNETEIKHRKIVNQFSTCFSHVSIFIRTLKTCSVSVFISECASPKWNWNKTSAGGRLKQKQNFYFSSECASAYGVDVSFFWLITLHGLAPPYLSDDCEVGVVADVGRRHLMSSDVYSCVVPRTQSQIGDRSFSVAGPLLWNNLPTEIRRRGTTFEHYRRLLKAFLFV